jgi:hypothetical protein
MFFVITTAHPKEIRPVITLCLHTVTRWAHEMSRFLSSFPDFQPAGCDVQVKLGPGHAIGSIGCDSGGHCDLSCHESK